jgi:TolA-binding protein
VVRVPKQRSKLRDVRIDELSGVDAPAQAGATVSIMKRSATGGNKGGSQMSNDETGRAEDISAVEKRLADLETALQSREAEIEKRDAELAKRDERIAALEDAASITKYADKAREILPNLKGTDVQRGELLKAAESIGDYAVEILKSANEAAAGAFEMSGATGEDDADSDAARAFDKCVEEIVKRDGVSRPVALAKARIENPAEYAAAITEA